MFETIFFEIKICDTRVAADTAGISGIDWIDASDTKMLSQYLDTIAEDETTDKDVLEMLKEDQKMI